MMMSSIVAIVAGLCTALPAIEVTRQDDVAWILGQTYASLKEDRLARALGVGNGLGMQYSEDNGRSWSGEQLISATEKAGEGVRKTAGFDSFFLDPDNGLFVRFFAESLQKDPTAGKSELDMIISGARTRRMYYQISPDAGRTWGPKLQIIQKGAEYNAEHWVRDVWFGKSQLSMEGRRILKLRDGTLLAPCQLWPTLEQRHRVIRKMGATTGFQFKPGAKDLPDEDWYFLATCLRGKWRDDLSAIDWESGGRVLLPWGYTSAGSCGSDEPTLAALDDGRIFCVVRTGSGALLAELARRKIAMARYCATSDDGGRSWKDVRPLTFSDGGALYSCCAYSEFIHSSKNGKWYWIGNILSEPTYGNNDPRYPLQIAELDPKTLGIKRDTVTVIQDRPADEPPFVRYSNFRVYEERGSNDFILLLMQDYSELEKNPVKRPGYRYRIKVPE